jgi:hypothetical protein
MSREIHLPAEQHVRAALADMLAEAAEGSAKPSVLALARRLGLSNATGGTSPTSPPRSARRPAWPWFQPVVSPRALAAAKSRQLTLPGSAAKTPG